MKSTLGLEDRLATQNQRCGALAVAGLIAAASFASLGFGRGFGPGPELKPFVTVTATIWSLADLLTGYLLLAQFYVNGRVVFGILALAYAVSGLMTWPFIFAFPGLFRTGPLTLGDEQIPSVLWLIWHCTFPVLVTCAALNDLPLARIVSRRTILLTTGAIAAAPVIFVAVVGAVVFVNREALPHFIIHGQFEPTYKALVLPCVVALNALSCLMFFVRRRPLTPLALWLALATFSATLDVVLVNLSSGRYSYAWDAGKVITVVTSSVVLIMLLCDIIGPITLGANERRYRALAEAMPQMVWSANREGCVQYWNRNWHEYTGATFTGLTGRVWAEVIHPQDLASFLEAWARSRRTGDAHEIEYRMRRTNDGAYRWHIGRVMPIRDESGAVEQWIGSCTDIHDYKVASETREVLDTIGHIVAIHTEDGSMVYASPRWGRYTGASTEAMLAHLWRDFIHPDDLPQIDAQLRRGRELELDALQYEMRIRAKDGEYRWFIAQTATLSRAPGTPRRWLKTLTDIDELKRTQTAALAAADAKSRFLATMSHEIRTPMNGIVGMAELVLLSELTAEQRECVRVIRDSSQSLLRVLNDILDYSKVEAGKLDLELLDFSIASQLDSVVSLLGPQFEAAQITLETRVDADLHDRRSGDPGRLRQVLLNLVGNALKFTPAGGRVTIRVNGEPGEGTTPIRVTVEDTGIGIASGVIERLFVPFSQADGSTTRRFGGTGLGLSISAQLVALMGGTIGVSSTPGLGSAFWFVVPLKPASAAQAVEGVGPRTPGRSVRTAERRPEKILVVEDNTINALVARKQLSRLGFEIVEAVNGREAVEAVGREHFDLVFMDLHMPEMDGYEATAQIRQRERSGSIRVPIVAMTADARDEDHQRCLIAGMDDFISKPASLENLQTVISRWTDSSRYGAAAV